MYCKEAGAGGDVSIIFSYDLHSRYLCPQNPETSQKAIFPHTLGGS